MIKIGLLGTQSFHAMAFTKLCNIPDENGKYMFDDVRITAVCGDDDTKEHLDAVVSEGKVENIVKTKEELSDIVDAVMILYRCGSAHLEPAIYFLNKGIPVWLDKPLCSSIEDINKLKETVNSTKTLFSGGSTLRYDSKVCETKEYVNSGALGKISGGVINHHGDLNSPYDGLYFYAPHAVQCLLDVFGYNPVSVKTTVLTDTNMSVAVKYEDKLVNVVINSHVYIPNILVYGEKEVYYKRVENSDCYKQGLAAFVKELKNEKDPVPFDELSKSVYFISAVLESIETEKEVKVL